LPNAWRSKGDEIGFVSTADAAALLGLTPSRQFLLLARLLDLSRPSLASGRPRTFEQLPPSSLCTGHVSSRKLRSGCLKIPPRPYAARPRSLHAPGRDDRRGGRLVHGGSLHGYRLRTAGTFVSFVLLASWPLRRVTGQGADPWHRITGAPHREASRAALCPRGNGEPTRNRRCARGDPSHGS
jgi:hypothetical protein